MSRSIIGKQCKPHKVSLSVKGWIDREETTIFRDTEGGDPLTFVLGEGEVIEGWEKGLMGMWYDYFSCNENWRWRQCQSQPSPCMHAHTESCEA